VNSFNRGVIYALATIEFDVQMMCGGTAIVNEMEF